MMSPEEEKKQRFARCVALEREGRLEESIREYEKLIADLGGAKEIFVNLGAVYAKKEKMDDAMRCFESAHKYGEDYIVDFNMGSVLYKQGHYREAIVHLRRCKRIKADFALASLVMGLCYSRLNEKHAAKRCFEEVLKSWKDNVVALTALAIIAFQEGEFQKALECTDKIAAAEPENKDILHLRAKILYRMERFGEYADAIKEIKKSSKGFKNFDMFIQSIPVDVYTDGYGRIDQKIESLKEKAMADGTASSLISLSLCHLFKGDTDRAIDCLVEARRRGLMQ